MQIEKRDALKSICTLSFAFKEAIRKEKYVSCLSNLANFEKEISFLIFNKRYKIRGIRCRSKKKKANSIVYLFWKVGLIFRNFKKIVLSSREFCKKKYYSYKDWNDTNVKGKISNTRCKLIATVSDQIDFDQSFRRGVESKAM